MSHRPRLSLIAALSENRAIGKGGQLPWWLPDDLRRFKERTLGHPIIMGRKTYESIGRPLPGRINIVVSRDGGRIIPGAIVVTSLEDAIEAAAKAEQEEIFIIGGGELYTQALPQADRLYLTQVHAIIDGDTFFPEYADFSRIISEERHENSEQPFTFLVLERM